MFPNVCIGKIQDGWIRKGHADFDQGKITEERWSGCIPRGELERHLQWKFCKKRRKAKEHHGGCKHTAVSMYTTNDSHGWGQQKMPSPVGRWEKMVAAHVMGNSAWGRTLRTTLNLSLAWSAGREQVAHLTLWRGSTFLSPHPLPREVGKKCHLNVNRGFGGSCACIWQGILERLIHGAHWFWVWPEELGGGRYPLRTMQHSPTTTIPQVPGLKLQDTAPTVS